MKTKPIYEAIIKELDYEVLYDNTWTKAERQRLKYDYVQFMKMRRKKLDELAKEKNNDAI